MASRLQIIKELRAKGASLKMIDDVALFLSSDTGEGYDSPVFVATVEFILKIKNMLKGMGMSQEQEMDISSLLGKKRVDTSQVNFGAAKAAVEGDEEFPDDVKRKILDHLLELEMQKDRLTEMSQSKETGQDFDLEGPQASKRKQTRESRRTGKVSLLEKISKILSAQQNTNRNQQRTQANLQAINNTQMINQQHDQQVNQQQQQQQQAQKNAEIGGRKESAIKANILRMIKMAKDKTVFGDNYKKNKFERRNSIIGESSKVKIGENEKPKEVSTELTASEAIHKAIQAKTKAVETKKPDEKVAFASKVEEKGGVRANEENVAKMKAQEAIEMLKNSGVRPSTSQPEQQLKSDLAAQQKAQAEQKQR